MNSTTGALIDSRYKSNVACGDVYGFKQKDTYLLASIQCTSFYLFLIDTTSFSFTIRLFSGTSLYGIAIDPSDGSFIIVGSKSSSGYTARFLPIAFTTLSDFTTDTLTMSAISASTDPMTTPSPAPVSATSKSVSSQSYVLQIVTYKYSFPIINLIISFL